MRSILIIARVPVEVHVRRGNIDGRFDKAELPAATAPSPEMIDAVTRCCAENNIAIVGQPLA